MLLPEVQNYVELGLESLFVRGFRACSLSQCLVKVVVLSSSLEMARYQFDKLPR
jgi:hypothetical protein